eukprot:scaffold2504_cov248-Chaetoceros_neogracile.AAC.2
MGHIPDPSDGNVSTIQHISTSIGSNIDTKSSAKFPNTETINASVQGKTSSEYVPESLPVQPDEVRGKLRYHKELEPLESNHGHDVDGYELTQLDAAYLSGSHDTGAGSIEDYSIFERDQINDINELERQQKQKIHSNEVVLEQRNFFSSQSIPTATTPFIMTTSKLPEIQRQKIMVTGGAGFVGSHLVDKLMKEGHEVIVVDNFFTGQKKNVEHWLQHPNFSLMVHDVTEPITLEVDQIYHLACPASPPHYQYNPVKTIKTSTMGTINMLGLAKRVKARMLLTSTSEIYGDPKEHPQKESYWGNVNTIGPRSCYDEGKRVAETMMYSYKNQNNVEVRVARIFNTFGPRMHPNDGRVVSNFIIQALQNKPLTIYGDGLNTRSFQYVSDLVDGLHALMNGDYDMPVNLGNPEEFTVGDLAEKIKNITGSESDILYLEKNQEDPSQRKPVIEVARNKIGWEPKVHVDDGLKKAIAYFQSVLNVDGDISPTGPGATKPKGGDAGSI